MFGILVRVYGNAAEVVPHQVVGVASIKYGFQICVAVFVIQLWTYRLLVQNINSVMMIVSVWIDVLRVRYGIQLLNNAMTIVRERDGSGTL
jgi:hypothetical protein